MQCPFCSSKRTSVKDSRSLEPSLVRRKRLCDSCSRGFATLERAHFSKVYVLGEFGEKRAFDSDRLFSAMRKSDKSGSVSDEILYAAVDFIAKFFAGSKKPITKEQLVRKASSVLTEHDPVAAARFICTHCNFTSVANMADTILEVAGG